MFTLALSALVTMGVQAQKQMGGEHNVEVSFTPFSGSPIDGSTIKYRNFMDDDKAFRLSLTMSNSSDVHAYMQDGELLAANPVSPQLNISSKSSTFGIAPGYEMHYDGMDNLSPYFAFELPITLSKREDSQEFWYAGEVSHLTGGETGGPQYDQWVPWDLTNSQSSTQVGLKLLFGADYYFSDGIYLGFEAGLGFSRTAFGNHSITTSNPTAFNILFNNAQFLRKLELKFKESLSVSCHLTLWKTIFIPNTSNSTELEVVQEQSTTGHPTTSATPPLETYSKVHCVSVSCLTKSNKAE